VCSAGEGNWSIIVGGIVLAGAGTFEAVIGLVCDVGALLASIACMAGRSRARRALNKALLSMISQQISARSTG